MSGLCQKIDSRQRTQKMSGVRDSAGGECGGSMHIFFFRMIIKQSLEENININIMRKNQDLQVGLVNGRIFFEATDVSHKNAV